MGNARTHLLEVGPDAFSLREVARRTGYAPAALYNHFQNREALINALAIEAVHALGAYMEAVGHDMPAPTRLLELCRAYLRFAADQPRLYRLVFDLLEAPSAKWDHFTQVAYPFTLLIGAVEDGLGSGDLTDARDVGAAGLAYGLWALVHGFVMLSAHHLANIADDLTPEREHSLSLYIAGLTAGRSRTDKPTPKE